MTNNLKEQVEFLIKENDGILQMKPCWVTRSFLPPGKRLGLTEAEYDAGERGAICERWIVSETQADNTIFTANEGQSFIKNEQGENILLPEALRVCRELILGKSYSSKHQKLDRLLKIYDYKNRLFYHIHQKEEDAKKVGLNSKEEAYHYLDKDLGSHPETYFGVHPYIVRENLQENIFKPYLEKWDGEEILKYAYAYLNVPGEGFHLPAGILHAPGTALTLELQESSDVMSVLQAEIDGIPMDKSLLKKHIAPEEWESKKEQSVLDLIDWKACADPDFFEHHHLEPRHIDVVVPSGVKEEWVWYNTTKFSGTRITIQPGAKYLSQAKGVHGLFVWRGKGIMENKFIEGQNVSLTDSNDEFLICHEKALKGVTIENTGNEQMVIFKFFGPDINNDIVPYLSR